MTDHKTGTREEWLAARLELLEAEKALRGAATSWPGYGRSCLGLRSLADGANTLPRPSTSLTSQKGAV